MTKFIAELAIQSYQTKMANLPIDVHLVHIKDSLKRVKECTNSSIVIINSFEIGERLTYIKEQLPNEEFNNWCYENLADYSIRTLERYIQLHKLRYERSSNTNLNDTHKMATRGDDSAKASPVTQVESVVVGINPEQDNHNNHNNQSQRNTTMRLRQVNVYPATSMCRLKKKVRGIHHGFFQQTSEEGNVTPVALVELTSGELQVIDLSMYNIEFTGNTIEFDSDPVNTGEYSQTLTNAELEKQSHYSEYSQLPAIHQNQIHPNIAWGPYEGGIA